MNKSLPVFLVLFLLCGKIFAQWNPDPAINTPVVLTADKGTTSVNSLLSASDGNGGMFITWTDTRNTASGADIFVTRILNTGTVAAGFLPGGTPVCTANGLQQALAITPDGVGGVIIAWGDPRSGNSDIYAQRINGQGTVLWTANGVPVANGPNSESAPVIDLISFDKVAVVWRNTVPASTLGIDLYANYLNLSDGSKVLGSDVTVISKDGAQSNQQILGDGIGGFLVVWTDNRTSTTNATLYGQHVSSTGALLWGPAGSEADGQLIINSVGNVLIPQIATDGSGGLVVAFASTRVSSTDANIYAQRVDFNGIPQWTADGISICTSPSNQSNVRIVKSGASTVVISWVDRRHSTNVALSDSLDIYAQALNPDGSIKWAENGNPVVRINGLQPLSATEGFEMLGDQLGGVYIVWDDNRNGNSDVYAQRILENGTNGWMANGQPICNNTSPQGTPEVVRSGDRLIVAWRDSRAITGNPEIYASQVQSDGILPVNILALQARPNGKNVLVQWTSKNEKSLSHFEVERSADAIDFTYAGKTKAQNAAGIFQYSFDDISPIGGNSFYRLKSVDKDGAFAYSNIVKVSLATISENDIHLFPNPAYTSANLQLNNLPAGRYSVRVMDMQGRVSQSQQVVISGDHQNVQIPVQRLSIGLYKVMIVNEKGERVGQQSLIKQ